MALFSRGKRKTGDTSDEAAAVDPNGPQTDAAPDAAATDDELTAGASAEPAAPDAAEALAEPSAAEPAPPEPSAAEPGEPVPHVGISVSTFGKSATRPAESPSASPADSGPPAIPGLEDNVPLRQALAKLPAQPEGSDLVAVARQLLQGHVFLRVRGDARSLLAAGESLPLATVTVGDKPFALVYSGGAALRDSIEADGDMGTSAMAQPVASVFRFVLAGNYAGILIDPSSAPARALLPRELLQRIVDEAGGDTFTLKSLICAKRTPETAGAIASALVTEKLWVAVGQTDAGPGIAEARTTEGERLIEIYSHPLEVIALGRGNQPVPITPTGLANVLRANPELSGVIVDPGGPWIRLSRDDLAALLALPPER